MSRVAAAAVASVGLALAWPSDGRAENPPDLSGVWTFYVEPGQQPFGFPGAGPKLPFTPAAQRKVDEYTALISVTGDNPGGWCLGTGMPGSMLTSGPYPMEIIQRPEQITVIYEAHAEIRRIFIREPLPEDELFPDRNGYSIGRWEGDTLIVETTHLKEQVDQTYAHSADARIVERYRLATKKWAYVPNGRLLPYECNEPAWNDHIESLRGDTESTGASE